MEKLSILNNRIKTLGEERFNKRVVLGNGNENADVVLVGEAPGAEEEKQGLPFVGMAGGILKDLTDRLELKGLYITNTVKIRPTKPSPKTGKPVNRPPNREELDFFIPFLFEEIELISPKVVVTLGNTPLRAFMQNNKAVIGDCHGRGLPFGINGKKFTLYPMYHPASVIYNRSLEAVFIKDGENLLNERING